MNYSVFCGSVEIVCASDLPTAEQKFPVPWDRTFGFRDTKAFHKNVNVAFFKTALISQ